jgi:hypothetical protein
MSEPTNGDIYGVLMSIQQDIGGLKAMSYTQTQAMENHGNRIGSLEECAARQRGAARVWGMLGTALASIMGGAVGWIFERHTH